MPRRFRSRRFCVSASVFSLPVIYEWDHEPALYQRSHCTFDERGDGAAGVAAPLPGFVDDLAEGTAIALEDDLEDARIDARLEADAGLAAEDGGADPIA